MAHFRGTLKGRGNETSRLGSKTSGLIAVLSSWDGSVEIHIKYNSVTRKNICTVKQTLHMGNGVEKIEAVFYVGE